MNGDLEVGLVLKADASGLKGEVKLSREELARLSKAAEDTGRSGTRAGAGLDRTAAGARNAAAGIGRIDARPIRSVETASNGAAGAIRKIGGLVAAAFAVERVTAFAAGAVRVEAAYEKIQTRLEFLTGGQARAAAEAELAAEAADRLATSEQAVLDIRSRLLPLENAGSLSRANSLSITEGLIDATKALGADTNQLGNVMYGLSQALSATIVRAEEYNQVVEPLPGLAQELDRAIAQMTDGAVVSFRRLVNEGEATRELFAEAMVEALGAFEGAGEKSAETISGKFQMLGTEWDRFRRAIVDSDLVRKGVDIAIRLVQTGTGVLTDSGPTLDERIAALRGQIAEGANIGAGAGPSIATARLQAELDVLIEQRRKAAIASRAQAEADRYAADAQAIATAETQRAVRASEALALAQDEDRTGKRADALRGKIERLRASIDEGLITAAEAAPALADLSERLDTLLNPKTTATTTTTARDGVATRVAGLRGEITVMEALAGAAALEGDARRDREIAILSEAAAREAGAKAGSAEADTLAALEARVLRLKDAESAREDAARTAAREETDRARERERQDKEIADRAERALEAAADAKEASDTRVAAMVAEAAAAERLAAAYGSGIAAGDALARRQEATAAAARAAEGGGDYGVALAAAERLVAAEADIADSRDRAAEAERAAANAAREHERAVARIRTGVEGMGDQYERAMARAAAWRDEALAGIDETKAGYAYFAAEAERVYASMLESTREGLIDQLTGELQRLAPTLARAVADARDWRTETLAALDTVGMATADHVATVEALYGERLAAAYEADLARRTDWAAGIERGLGEIAQETADWASQSESLVTGWASAAEDAFTSLARTGKFEMKSLVDTVLADMARLVYRQTVGKAASSLIGSAVSGIGSLFGGSLFDIPAVGEVQHTGGIAGAGSAARTVSAGVFAGARRYHTGGIAGLSSGEVPIIAQRGEPIFTPRQFDNMNGMISALAANASRPVMVEGGGAGQVVINNYAAARVEQRQRPGGGVEIDILAEQVIGMVDRDIRSGSGRINGGIESTYRMSRNFSGGRR